MSDTGKESKKGYVQKYPKSEVRSIRFKSQIVEGVQKLADKENRNFSNMVETILLQYLKDNP